jgi:dTDP-4-dehydrorhamnose reductase
MTVVTRCESDWAVTVEGPVRLAMAAAKHGCRLLHVSSDAVFSGARVRRAAPRRPVREASVQGVPGAGLRARS